MDETNNIICPDCGCEIEIVNNLILVERARIIREFVDYYKQGINCHLDCIRVIEKIINNEL
jgi:predicted nucleic-acid-binding protein